MADIPYRQLSIASFNFSIQSQHTKLSSHHYDPAYNQFLSPAGNPESHPVTVRLLDKKTIPSLSSLEKQFETPRSWSLYRNADSKFIVFPSQGSSNEPEWVARIYADLKNVDIFCEGSANPVHYPLDQILLINLLVGRGFIIHAAGAVIDGRGYIFAGPSGAGKSTISSLLLKENNVTIFSDDRIVIKKIGHEFLMFGTPWPGDAGIAVNDCARLYGIFFLSHSQDNSIKELRPGKALANLCKVTSLPWYDGVDLQESFDLCEDLLQKIKTFELNFRPGPEIIDEIISCVSK